MFVYLDDERTTPDDWVRTKNVADTIYLLKNKKVEKVSLDHDLGMDTENGYDVLLWIEEQVFTNPSYVLPDILIHTANPSARIKMKLGVDRINKKYFQNK